MSPTSAPTALPGWVAQLSDQYLRAELGPSTFSRGAAYSRSSAVTALTAGREGRVLLAGVRGSRGRTYSTVVTLHEADTGPAATDDLPDWTGQCSCPMGGDCKHVVAVLLTARNRVAASGATPTASWERTLAELVRKPSAAGAFTPLGLQVDLVTPPAPRYAGAAPPGPELRLRPVAPGKNGGWIRTGMSWRELEHGYGASRVDPSQREPVLALLATARSRANGSYYGAEQHLTGVQLGPSMWRLLRDVEQSGVALVTGQQGRSAVAVAEEPASVVLDASTTPGGGLRVAPRLRLPGGGDSLPDRAGTVDLVGVPPHAVAVNRDGGLLVARFDRPLDPSLGRLLTRGEEVQIPAADASRFLGLYYPVLRQVASVVSSDDSVSFPEIVPPRLALAVGFEPGHETLLRWSFLYTVGDESVHVPVVGDEGPARDPAAEAALLESLDVLDLVPGLGVLVGTQRRLVPEQRLRGLETATFVRDVLPALTEREDVEVSVQGTPLDYHEVEAAPVITVSATDGDGSEPAAGGDWFDLGVTVTVSGEEVPFTPLFTALARGETHLILDSGRWFGLDRPELHALRRLIEEARALQDGAPGQLRVTAWNAGLWQELVEIGVVDQQSERWARTVEALLDLESIPEPDLPAGFGAELRDYQREGYRWLSFLWDFRLGGVLADDMGLGKTVQTLAMAARGHQLGSLTPAEPLLIVAPTSVLSTWRREAERFCPELGVAVVTETTRRSGRPLAEVTAGAHLVVTSFALLRIDEAAYCSLTWSGLVLDEAQFVKNHQAKTYQVARRLPAPFKLAITGTPLENSLMDLWSLLSIVAPGLFPSPQRFTELYRRPIESGESPELLATLRRRIRPLMLRRTKEQVAADLPPKIEQVLSVTLNPQQQRIYQTRLQRERQRVLGMLDDVNRNRIAILASLTVLRQLALDVSLVDKAAGQRVPSSKIDALVQQLHELAAEGHRALVFSQFTGFLRLVRDRLAAERIDHVYLDGRTRNRPGRIAEFTDGDAPVFLISLKAGGSGLTLTEADYVFVLDPWWNPATEAQAVDRTHRIGQHKTVMVYRLVAEGTIEEKVVELQRRKRDLFTRVVDADGVLAAPLGADDIRELLSASEPVAASTAIAGDAHQP